MIHPVNILVMFVFMFRLVSDGDGQAAAGDASGEDKEPGEEKSSVVDNREDTSTPVADVTTTTTTTTHREEKKEPQTTIKTLLPVIRSPSHAQEISGTDRSAFSLSIFYASFREGYCHIFQNNSVIILSFWKCSFMFLGGNM